MSVRTVQTDFTSSSWSYSPLHPIPMNVPQTQQQQSPQAAYRTQKFPPGLAYNLPAATESSPSLMTTGERTTTTRRRSGGFTYPPGQTYHHGLQQPHPQHTGLVNLAAPPRRRASPQFSNAVPQRRAASPTAPAASLQPAHSPIKFDPFASDDTPTSEPVYNHYWQYNSTTKGPMLVYKNKSAAAASSGPYTIKLPTESTVSLPATSTTSKAVVTRSTPPRSSPQPLPKPDRNARARLVAGILLNRIYAVGKPMRRRFLGAGGDKTYVPSGLSSVISIEC